MRAAIAASVAASAWAAFAGANANEVAECRARFEQRLDALRDMPSGRERDNAAENAAMFLGDNPWCGRSTRIIEMIVVFLSDDQDAVRADAASMLGALGPDAKPAVPALRAALKRSYAELDALTDMFMPAAYSGQVIRWALEQITGEPVPEYSRRRR